MQHRPRVCYAFREGKCRFGAHGCFSHDSTARNTTKGPREDDGDTDPLSSPSISIHHHLHTTLTEPTTHAADLDCPLCSPDQVSAMPSKKASVISVHDAVTRMTSQLATQLKAQRRRWFHSTGAEEMEGPGLSIP
jgi:hypothetical protein